MEIKINKEIRDYKEGMFWGLSLRQFLFFINQGFSFGRHLLFIEKRHRNRSNNVGVHTGNASVCIGGLSDITECRQKAFMGSNKVKTRLRRADLHINRRIYIKSFVLIRIRER